MIEAHPLDSEYAALLSSPFNETQWFDLPRDERVRRVTHVRDHRIIDAIAGYDAHEKARKKAETEAKRKRK